MRKITVITPVKDVESRRKIYLPLVQSKDLEIEFEGIQKGIQGVATYFDKTIIAPEVLNVAYQAELNGTEAVIINCLSEPGLYAAKELLSVPVIGIFETCLQAISVSQNRFSILIPQFSANYSQILAEAIKLKDLNELLVSLSRIDLDQKILMQKKMIEKSIKTDICVNKAQAIILSSTKLTTYMKFCSQIIQEITADVGLMIPLKMSVEYVTQILNGHVEYDKHHLLPPNLKKVEQWREND